ncbi:hypothetical protein [Streptomyces sp. NBC_01408]|uniref:hypothetical protein n=1 Tax=Streptomyces sp. NBC_01408 TaxID=2903855 RepID=UPI002254900C|nr:hypothetical protein [Streptomyces sp. NBC_01408]MCX4692798.1 hypothetical protein [Streptomyces sp. NBC_01408]
MSAERAQGRGWVRIPASRAEQPPAARTGGYAPGPHGSPYEAPYAPAPYEAPYAAAPYAAGPYAPGPYAAHQATGPATDHATIYLSLVKRWREAGRTLPGHPDEEWERLISQPCWPGR